MKKILSLGLFAVSCFSGNVFGVIRTQESRELTCQEPAGLGQKVWWRDEMFTNSGKTYWKTISIDKLSAWPFPYGGITKIRINGADCRFTGEVLDVILRESETERVDGLCISSESMDDTNMEKLAALLKKTHIGKLCISPDNLGGHSHLTVDGLNKLKKSICCRTPMKLTVDFPWLKDRASQYILDSIREFYADNTKSLYVVVGDQGEKWVSLEELRLIGGNIQSIDFCVDRHGALKRTMDFLKTKEDLIFRNVSLRGNCVSDDNIECVSELFWMAPYTERLSIDLRECSEDGFDRLTASIIGSRLQWVRLEMSSVNVGFNKFHKSLLRMAYSRWGEGQAFFNVQCNRYFRSVSLLEFVGSPNIEYVYVYDNSVLASAVMENAKDKAELRGVHLVGESINDGNMQKLRELIENNASIHEVSIRREDAGNGTSLTEVGLEVLKTAIDNSNHVKLFNFECPNVHGESFEKLCSSITQTCMGRRTLWVKVRGKFQAVSFQKFVEEDRPINQVDIRRDSQLTSAVLSVLPGKNVRDLLLIGSSINDNNMALLRCCLEKNCSLEKIRIDVEACNNTVFPFLTRAGFDDMEAGVMASERLKKFHFSYEKFDDVNNVQERCENMKQICLGRCKIDVQYLDSDEWVTMPLRDLNVGQGIKAIRIEDNDDATVKLLKSIKFSKEIKILEFLGFGISNSNVWALKEFLEQNSSIESITIAEGERYIPTFYHEQFIEIKDGVVASPSLISCTLYLNEKDYIEEEYEIIQEAWGEMKTACARRAAMRREAAEKESSNQSENDK